MLIHTLILQIVERRRSALQTPSPPQSPAHRAKSPNGIIGTCIPRCLTDSTESTLVANHLLLTHVTQHDLHKRVVIAGVKKGVLKYFGRTHFQEGIWCGVQLDEPEGKHNGQVHGVQYFECDYDRGVFAPLHKVALESQAEKSEEGLATLNTLKRQNTFTIDDEERSKRSSVEGQNSLSMESHSKKRPTTAPASGRKKVGQLQGSPKVLDSTYSLKTGSPKRANKTQGPPKNPTHHFQDHQKTIQRRASSSGSLGKGRRNSPEMDESLGILSPTEMQGLPSLSTSICSNFAWEHPRSPEELAITSQTLGKAFQDVSMSTPHEKSEIFSPRLSLSPIKTFSLDSEKLKAIESITIDDNEHPSPAIAHSTFNQNLPVERKLKGYDNECDLLFARTEQLLKSCRQKREKAQQLEMSALSLLEDKGEMTTIKVSNKTTIQPGNETIVQPCNETVVQEASKTMVVPGNETIIQLANETTIIESSDETMVLPSKDTLLIENIEIPDDFDGPQADPDSTYAKDHSNKTFHNNNETLSICPKDIFDTTKSLPTLEVKTLECPRAFNRVLDADCMTSSKTDSIDTGLGSMPSSMISMATSQDLHSDMETSVSESLSNKVYEQKISPISEREETPSTDLDITLKLADITIEPPENPEIEPTPEIPPKTKRKHSENGHLGVEKPALKRNRSTEKGLATKRSEMLTKERIMPNTNVPSKLKAMLETNKEVAAENFKKKKEKKAGRWDEIMKNIAESQKQTMGQVKKTKEVKSKVFEGFKPPPMARNRSNLGSNRSLAR